MKLVTKSRLDEAGLRAIVPTIEIVRAGSDEHALAEVADAEILIVGSSRESFSQLVHRGRKLRWVHCTSAGVGHLLDTEILQSDALLTCAKGEPVGGLLAEHAFALLLSLTRGIAHCARQTDWDGCRTIGGQTYELAGKTLGIVGFGGVGQALMRRALAFDMEVIVVKRAPPENPVDGVQVWPQDRLCDMLDRADAVVLTVPLTARTEGLIGSDELQRMKSSAILINVGRGQTVQTAALVDALTAGQIAGAGLDVVDPEPLPDDHALWRLPNVILTPHIAGNSPERAGRNQALIEENLRRLVAAMPLLSQVDKTHGY